MFKDESFDVLSYPALLRPDAGPFPGLQIRKAEKSGFHSGTQLL